MLSLLTTKMSHSCLAFILFGLLFALGAESTRCLDGSYCSGYCCGQQVFSYKYAYVCSWSCIGYECSDDFDCHGGCCNNNICEHCPTTPVQNSWMTKCGKLCRLFGDNCSCDYNNGKCQGKCSIILRTSHTGYAHEFDKTEQTNSPVDLQLSSTEEPSKLTTSQVSSSRSHFSNAVYVVGVSGGGVGVTGICFIILWLRYLRRKRRCVVIIHPRLLNTTNDEETSDNQEEPSMWITPTLFQHSQLPPYELHPDPMPPPPPYEAISNPGYQ